MLACHGMPTQDAASAYSHPQSLAGHVAIVTGAARGVGRGIAPALLSRGAAVLVTDILGDELAGAVAEFDAAGFRVASLVADLCDPDAPQRIVGAAVEAFGTVNALINNAIASNEPKPFVDVSAADYDVVYDVGPRVTFRLMQTVHPIMARAGGGSIVNLGSGAGTGGEVTFGAYSGAKEAIRGMSKVAAREWGGDGIRVNVICPLADTDGMKALNDLAPKHYQRVVRSTALGRLGDPTDDIGGVVAFLIGNDAAYLTGQTLLVDGGAGCFR